MLEVAWLFCHYRSTYRQYSLTKARELDYPGMEATPLVGQMDPIPASSVAVSKSAGVPPCAS